MGLDVTLKYCKDLAAATAAQNAAEAECNKLWDSLGKAYDDVTEQEKEHPRAQMMVINKSHGLSDWGTSPDIQTIEEASKIDPNHVFKIGYLRSSYNSGGINSVLSRAGCLDLYDIFEPGDDYLVHPDWDAALVRVNRAIDEYKDYLNGQMGKYDVMRVGDIGVGGAKDEAGALRLFKEQLDRKVDGFRAYSNRDGVWYLDGIKVLGVIRNSGYGGGSFLIYEKDHPVDRNWYLTALEITREMIQYVRAKPDRKNYFLSWSA